MKDSGTCSWGVTGVPLAITESTTKVGNCIITIVCTPLLASLACSTVTGS